MLKQAINLPDINNARELGGYIIGDKCVKKNTLIRTAGLMKLSAGSEEILQKDLRVRTIVDFRMKMERENAPDPVIEGVVNTGLSVIEYEDYTSIVDDPNIVKEFASPNVDRMWLFENAYKYGMLGPDSYVRFLLGERGIAAYRDFFGILLKNDPDKGAVLWHCTDGKDRTGLAAMLILSALGADRKTILDDYMLTNEYNKAAYEPIVKKIPQGVMPQEKYDALVFVSGGVVERYMTNAIDTLEKKYGSVTSYIKDELGVSSSDIELLREKYLH